MFESNRHPPTFRLPEATVGRVAGCVTKIRAFGSSMTRADVVRLLVARGIGRAESDVSRLLPRSRARLG